MRIKGGTVFRTEIVRLLCRLHLPRMVQVMSSCVFLVSKYSYDASFQTNAEAWVVTEELEGVGKIFVGRDVSVEEEGQPALLQLLSHLPSLSDDNPAFLMPSGGRARVNLLPKLVSGPLCTNFYIVSFKTPRVFRVFGLRLVMLLFVAKMFYCIKYLKKSCVSIVDSSEYLSCMFYSCESYFVCIWFQAKSGLKLLKGNVILKLKREEGVFTSGFLLRSISKFDSGLEDSWAVKD